MTLTLGSLTTAVAEGRGLLVKDDGSETVFVCESAALAKQLARAINKTLRVHKGIIEHAFQALRDAGIPHAPLADTGGAWMIAHNRKAITWRPATGEWAMHMSDRKGRDIKSLIAALKEIEP